MKCNLLRLVMATGFCACGWLDSAPAQADEGMWLYNQPPRKLLAARYDFNPTDEWLDHLQRACVRFNSGGSGSFVSANGLVMTNHHVGADCLQKLSTPQRDYLKTGFHARTLQEEVPCVDLEINVLVSIEDVTERVKAAVADELDPAAASAARRAVMNTIEQESFEQTGLRSDLVTLYQGGQYHLYRYKKYTDVRLVFAPEQEIAFFGGDPDNFEYPRYDLDICFFRAYENHQPAPVEHYLSWSAGGAGAGELVFVSGHPGRTDRLNTVRHLEFLRDAILPRRLAATMRREVLLCTYSQESRENARRAQDELFGYKNRRKALLGRLAGLQDPSMMDRKRADERSLRKAVMNDSDLRSASGEAWDQVIQAIGVWDEIQRPAYLLEGGGAFNSELFDIARTIVRLVAELEKPNPERLREYAEAGLESLELELYSEKPIYPDLETVKLADSLGMYLEIVGFDELAQHLLAGRSPRERAGELIEGTTLDDVEVRRKLVAGGVSAVEASDDPLIRLARLVDGPSRRLRKIFEEQVDEPLEQAYAKISQARFALLGKDQYPDATFTLRLALGTVRGYREAGRDIPPWTTLEGAYIRAGEHGGVAPFKLPESWLRAKGSLDLDTPFNFVSTADIIGGNSGSPVVNRQGELVGIIFDGNIQSLVLDFIYTDEQARAVAVHSSGILEALRKVYGADQLLAELGQ